MGRKFYLPLILLLLSFLVSRAQTGEIRGKITEKGGKEIPFASVAALVNGIQVQATIADFEGNYTIKPLNPAKYDIKATSVGYSPVLKTGVIVTVDKISFVDVELTKGIEIKEVEVVDYQNPLIDKGSPSQQKTLTFEEIQALPSRDVNSAASQSTGVYQKDEGGALNIRGSRSDATSYYVDGIKVNGSPGISQRGTEQITVITGGIPAQYGDATGGIISVTTRGPSNQFGGGVELATSEFLDAYGYNLVSANLTGPLIREKDEDGNKTGQSLAGFFVAGEYQYDKDPDPSYIPIHTVKGDILNDVYQKPLVAHQNPDGSITYIHRSSYFTNDSFNTQKYRENVAAGAYRINGKIDIRPVKNLTLTVGGSFERVQDDEFVNTYTLMNFENNPEKIETKWRGFAKLTQRFVSEEKESSSSIKNAFYTIQVDYTNTERIDQNKDHKKNYFDYGYIGKFKSYARPEFTPSISSGFDTIIFTQTGNVDTSYTYDAGTLNPYTSNYTTQYYDLTDPLGTAGYQDNLNNVLQGGGLVNGDNRNGLNVYGLWSTTGRVVTQYQVQNQIQGRISASGSAQIKNHSIMVGFEYEQRTERGFNISPSGLWTLMRQLGNQNSKLHDVNPDTEHIEYLVANGTTLKYITYGRGKYTPIYTPEGEATKGFFENVRDLLGVSYDINAGTDTIQTDFYDPSTYNLNLFTPDELFNSGSSLISYYGYDYTGENENLSKWDLKDFYVDKDENNNYLRKIDAFRPVYMAGYVQDMFQYNDILFNVGVRVDRFDANQKVLNDPYSLYQIIKAGDPLTKNLTDVPSNIKNDYAVYVDNTEHATKVVGYRNGSTWYDEHGTVITDLDPLTANGPIQPYLTASTYEDYKNTRVNPNAFSDYTPQVSFMPRIAFSFPISDEAYFAADYDVLTQRPQSTARLRFDPIEYLQWSQGVSGDFNNPNLKPEKTTVYEINFQQKLSRSSAFSITAFYKEMRNNIQSISLDYAFPINYTTYGNIDFGNVKGLTFYYDLRRTSNIRMNLSYTLSFADGTGSSSTSNAGILAQQGQTNLREIKPLDFDQRHTLVTSIDFHYGAGKDYNGPIWFNRQFFSNSGLNLVFRGGSGAPYTRQSNITPTADFTTTENSRSVISGQINGSRYPWNFRIDAKIDKNFEIKTRSGSEGESRKSVFVNVYLQVLNVLNTENITTVYAATGSADDDGYLASPNAQPKINQLPSPEAYNDLYRIKVNDPANYDLPRRIRLGVQVNF